MPTLIIKISCIIDEKITPIPASYDNISRYSFRRQWLRSRVMFLINARDKAVAYRPGYVSVAYLFTGSFSCRLLSERSFVRCLIYGTFHFMLLWAEVTRLIWGDIYMTDIRATSHFLLYCAIAHCARFTNKAINLICMMPLWRREPLAIIFTNENRNDSKMIISKKRYIMLKKILWYCARKPDFVISARNPRRQGEAH